jgi:hypothetical protein
MIPARGGIPQGMSAPTPDPEQRHVDERAELLPEEQTVGSADPRAQAAAVLEESEDRTEHPDPDASTQSGRRASPDTV